MYELKIYNSAGSDVWVIPFENMTLTEVLNKGVSGSVSINYQPLARYATRLNTTVDNILSAEYREWKLFRNGTLFYAGVLMSRRFSGSRGQATALTLDIAGYEQLLANRITGNAGTWAYTADDSADIAWDLIDQSQNDSSGFGDVGITRGTHPTTVDRDNTCRYSNILNEIISMSASKKWNGYDWQITPLKVFDIYYPTRGEVKADIILDDFNIISWNNNKALVGTLANRVIVVGSGGEDDIVSATVEDTSVMDTWYLQERVLAEKSTELVQNLQDKGDELLQKRKEPSDIVSIKVNDKNPLITEYQVGDTLTVKISELGLDQALRLEKRTMQIQRSGEAQVDLSFLYG